MEREFGNTVNLDDADFKAKHPELSGKLVTMSKQAYGWLLEKATGAMP